MSRLHRLLPLWFLGWSSLRLWQLGVGPNGLDLTWLGRDYRIYRNAAEALLAGTDPWAAADVWNGTQWHYGAPPSAAQLFVPFALLPEVVGLGIFLAGSIALTLAALRHLGLPWWWILFPPMMEGIGAANPHVPALALIVLTGPWLVSLAGPAVAVGLKIYAVVPLVGERRWRQGAAAAGLLLLSLAVSPALWAEYLSRFGEISKRLAAEAVGGVSAALFLDPAIVAPAVGDALAPLVALAIFLVIAMLVALAAAQDVRAAGWLAVPLLWPAAQYSYGTFVLPVARRPSIWLIAIPTIPTYLAGLILLAYEITAGRPAIVAGPPAVGLIEWLGSLRPSVPIRRS